jgi:hypothetical protein
VAKLNPAGTQFLYSTYLPAPLELAGIGQINIRVPVGAGTGPAVQLWIVGSDATTGMTITVQ